MPKQHLSTPASFISPSALVDFLYRHRWPLSLGALGSVLLLVGFWGYVRIRSQWEAEAQAQLTAALEASREFPATTSGKLPVGEWAMKLEEVVEALTALRKRYGSTTAAEHALLQLGDVSYRLGRYRDALTSYQQYLEQYPRGWGVLLAGLGKGHALEALGQLEEAAVTFRSLAERYKGHPLTGEALASLGRCLEGLVKQEEAKEVYLRILKEYPGTSWARLAERRLVYEK